VYLLNAQVQEQAHRRIAGERVAPDKPRRSKQLRPGECRSKIPLRATAVSIAPNDRHRNVGRLH
jgi:hypothetical protein